MLKTIAFTVSMVLCIGALSHGGRAEEVVEVVSIESMPPSVIKTVPQCGDSAVDPGLSEVWVTFSKEMKVTGHCWSWCSASDSSFPALDGKAHFLEDKCTCVLPVKLEPGRAYAIWINSAQYHSFQDPAGHRAVPYLLVFETGPKR